MFKNKLSGIQSFIQDVVQKVPGIRYRQLQRITGLANGTLSYNILLLERIGTIKVQRTVGVTRFFLTNVSEVDAGIIGMLREPVRLKITQHLLTVSESTFGELLNVVKRSPSTLFWHLEKLNSSGMIVVGSRNRSTTYKLRDPETVSLLMERYEQSFIQRSADNFIETWREL